MRMTGNQDSAVSRMLAGAGVAALLLVGCGGGASGGGESGGGDIGGGDGAAAAVEFPSAGLTDEEVCDAFPDETVASLISQRIDGVDEVAYAQFPRLRPDTDTGMCDIQLFANGSLRYADEGLNVEVMNAGGQSGFDSHVASLTKTDNATGTSVAGVGDTATYIEGNGILAVVVLDGDLVIEISSGDGRPRDLTEWFDEDLLSDIATEVVAAI